MEKLVELKKQTKKQHSWALTTWLKTTALQKAGVTAKIKKKKQKQKRCCDCIEKDFLQIHATNNHSDINFPLKFLLMMFLSDALMVSNGCISILAEKSGSAVSSRSCSSAASQCIHPHCTTGSLWGCQHLLSVLCISYPLKNLISKSY